ncbi:hypothetical protein [Zavarzinia sp.]|uniref:hypothetical protein n=1 Tax=Zavarzinia sp. TaxID=2027920 RepID=UPI003BB6753F
MKRLFGPVLFALRHWWSREALGLAAIEVGNTIILLAASGRLTRFFTDPYFMPFELMQMERETNGLYMLLSIVTLPFVVALVSRLNGRLFGRPLPVGPVEGAFRWAKAQILGGLTLIAVIVIPYALVILVTKSVLPGAIDTIGATAAAIAVAAVFVLANLHIFYLMRVLYEGRSSFGAARRLSRGQRFTLPIRFLVLVAAILAIGALFILPLLFAGDSRVLKLAMYLALNPLAATATVPIAVLFSRLYFEAEAAAR